MSELWYTTFDAVFFITVSTLVCGTVGVMIRHCLKSKCDTIDICFGLIKVHRDIKAEIEEDIIQMNDNDETKTL